MYVTRQADYAVRCVLYLAKAPRKIECVSAIAGEMHIPRGFLAKILQRLARAGLVKSVRGIKGGFQLARRPRDINLLEVIEAVQGPSAMNECAVNPRICRLSATCAVHPIWVELRKSAAKRLKRESFAKLALQT
ncbi:MAG: Rrf2 family transcriptional regulator [Lentisphaerae bacterium]|nr:Rrf2 family transcriptional regulator [Lentisphaerota bacterium]